MTTFVFKIFKTWFFISKLWVDIKLFVVNKRLAYVTVSSVSIFLADTKHFASMTMTTNRPDLTIYEKLRSNRPVCNYDRQIDTELPWLKIQRIEFFAISTALPIIAMLASKIFTAAKKLRPDDHWIRSLMFIYPTEVAWHVLVSLKLLDP